MVYCEEGEYFRDVWKGGNEAVVDAGFLEGGIMHEIFMPRQLSSKPHPFLSIFEKKLLTLPVNPYVFNRDLCLGMLR